MWHIREHHSLDKIIPKLPLQVIKKYELWKENGTKYIGCNEYNIKQCGILYSEICGCDYAPKHFWKYHVTNSYGDDIAYSNMPWTYKVGVRIFK
jgi:hypothetical protein